LEAPVSFGVGLPCIPQKKRGHFPLTKRNEAGKGGLKENV